jgi:16S rRNA (guanine966-N2)-methyltransferase
MRIAQGRLRGRIIRTIERPGCRPATAKVREAVMSMLAARGLDFGRARVLDVFAGSGAMGFEAVSRGAPGADFMEKDRAVAAVLRENCKTLELARDECRVMTGDALKLLARAPGEPYHLRVVDPPYGQDLLAPALAAIVEHGWAAEGGFVVAEMEEAEADAVLADVPASLTFDTSRNYGQTRIVIWKA